MLAVSSRFLTLSIIAPLFLCTACSNSNQPTNSATNSSTNSATSQTPSETTTEAETANTTEPTGDNSADLPNYIVAVENEYKPFSFRDENAQLIGYDVDILDAIAKDQNFTVTYIPAPFSEKFQDLKAKKYDIVAAGTSITDERKKTMDFSNPYHDSYQAVIALPNQPVINNFENLIEHTIAVEPNTISDKFLKETIKINPSNIIPVTTPFTAIEKVIQNQADYAISDSPVLQYYGQQFQDLDLKVYIDKSSEPDHYGFVVAKNRDDDLLQKINTGLNNIKADGTYQAINQKWFGQ
ncbi:substrate-binding periplasmic protein [Psychrobacter sp. I-STPA10]|uniref:substrate-binding periplasmic protein n=1 Tax=Psychrobacter sp. I-STPA10 TaxID=2585769 RepID=UPI001E5B5BE1|nr:transporter substrate-binding domain-containing protein [Psychrobacter sp. I-STPA10]